MRGLFVCKVDGLALIVDLPGDAKFVLFSHSLPILSFMKVSQFRLKADSHSAIKCCACSDNKPQEKRAVSQAKSPVDRYTNCILIADLSPSSPHLVRRRPQGRSPPARSSSQSFSSLPCSDRHG